MSFDFRWMRGGDVAALVRLQLRWGAEDVLARERLQDYLDPKSSPPRRVLLGFVDRQAAGMIAFVCGWPDGALVTSLLVQPEHRRKGLGSALLSRLRNTANPKYARDKLVLLPRESDVGTQMFLKSQGYVCNKIMDGFYGSPPEAAYRFVHSVSGDVGCDCFG